MTQLLQDRIAIVTGAGRGLGRSHVLELAGHGARVLVNDKGADQPSSEAHTMGTLCTNAADLSAHALIGRLDEIADRRDETVPATGFDPLRREAAKVLRVAVARA